MRYATSLEPLAQIFRGVRVPGLAGGVGNLNTFGERGSDS